MIGLDTNVIVRYLTQDDKKQSLVASNFIENNLNEKNMGFITLITLVEVTWVLESCYNQKKADLEAVIESLLTIKQILVESTDVVYLALRKFREGKADFSDALILTVSEEAGCDKIVSFDKKALSIGMEML